jgi:hypothetical protein
MITNLTDVFSEEFINRVFAWHDSTKGGDVWSSNQTKWVDVLKYATSGTLLSRVIPDDLKHELYLELLNRGKINYYPYSSSALFYVGYSTSCVNWHNDWKEYDAMSIYLNKDWDSNWGGWFAWTEAFKGEQGNFNPKTGNFYCPQYNTAILSTEQEWHCTTPLATVAPPRISIQLFFSKQANGA